MGKPAARLGDMTSHGGTIVTGSSNVFLMESGSQRAFDACLPDGYSRNTSNPPYRHARCACRSTNSSDQWCSSNTTG